MYRYIRSQELTNNIWYRAVRKGADPLEYNDYELGIHCGTLDQAQHIAQRGNYNIYEIILDKNVEFSNPVDDFEAWNSVEAVASILSDGFQVDVDRNQVLQDFRDGIWDKDNAAEYIVDEVNSSKFLAVKYNNAIELNEEDIIILERSAIAEISQI